MSSVVGDDFWASGIGFQQNEGGIQVLFDGVMIASGVVADANGSWAIPLKVPPTGRGKHTVNASAILPGWETLPVER